METSIELEIQSLLTSMGDPALVADEMLKRWHRGELPLSDRDRVAFFLLQFGFTGALAENLALLCKNKEQLPWGTVAELLLVAPNKPDKQIYEALFLGAGEQNSLLTLCRDPRLDEHDPRFSKVRIEMSKQAEKKLEDLKLSLLNLAEIHKNDRLEEKEKEALSKLKSLFPSDYTVRERWIEYNTRLARERFSKAGVADPLQAQYQNALALTPEQEAVADKVSDKLIKLAKKDPEMAYNLSLALFQMGHIESAIKVLNQSKQTYEVQWLKLELLLEAHRYLDVLSHLDHLEELYANESATVPAVMYARAKALWGLNQPQPAIRLLEDLVRVKPDYRSAHALLMDWREASE